MGREEWDEDLIKYVLDECADKPPKVYSQEMFLCYLATGTDPFDDVSILPSFRRGHPALEYLSTLGFRWPDTAVDNRAPQGNDARINRQPESPLSRLQYNVGTNSKTVSKRRAVLTQALQEQLPFVGDVLYMREWGTPGSVQRFERIRKTYCRLLQTGETQDPAQHRSDSRLGSRPRLAPSDLLHCGL